MPSLFAHGLQGLPPTPPHVRMESEQPFYVVNHSASAFPPRYHQNGCDFIEQYSQATCYTKPAPMSMHSQPTHSMRGGRDAMASYAQRTTAQPMFGPMATGPVLPPLRNNLQLPPMDSAIPSQYRRQDMVMMQTEQHRKEEKATGGVAAHLDYEMDQMSDFVAEMAQGMYDLYITKINLADIDFVRSVYPGTSVQPRFRKYVYQILSSTRLPSSTILLGLYYLASRMRMLSAARVYNSDSAQVYRMLTIALLLGSKFLDDNTFQNKSWAEVSNIPVAELNTMELEWLFAFEWKIHDRIHDKEDGFATWLTHWDTWRAKAVAKAQETRLNLAPIDTNVARTHMSKPLQSPEGPIPLQYQPNTQLEHSYLNPAAVEYSPPSAPHSGPHTPDYYSVGPWGYPNPVPYPRPWMQPPQQQYIPHPLPRSQPPSYHATPSYAPFAPYWTGHGSSCYCGYCAKPVEHYTNLTNAFTSMQPAVA